MYNDDLYIALDDDSAAYSSISTLGFLADIFPTWAKPKTNAIDVLGINGVIDTSAVFGVHYSNRQITLRLTVKDTVSSPETKVDSFVQAYNGEKVRIRVGTSYFFRGRLSVTVDDFERKLRQVTCVLDADPLRYATTYTPNSSGLDLRPTAWSENLWSAANVNCDGYSTVTSAGGTVSPNPAVDSYGFIVKATTLPDGKLAKIYLQNLVNCTVEIQRGERTIGTGTGSHIYLSTGIPIFIINVYPIDKTQPASFGCILRTIDATTINNSGKAVPIQIDSTYVPNVNYPVKMFINGTIFTVKPEAYSGDWKEYAPAILKSGANYVATFVDVSTFDPSDVGSSGVLNVRYRAGVL